MRSMEAPSGTTAGNDWTDGTPSKIAADGLASARERRTPRDAVWQAARSSARDPFGGEPGPWNAITDVPGVEVGLATLISGESVRTGVTAIHPRGRAELGDPYAAGFHSQNGNGEMTGVSWIEESGTAAGPIAITNTHAVGIAHAGVVAWTVKHHPDVADAWLLPVAAETWDGYLNDINGGHVTVEVAVTALESASTGPVEEGSVGGGTGMNCYAYKGGSGTASRTLAYGDERHVVGVFVQTNFGVRRELTIAGVPDGRGARGRRSDRRSISRRLRVPAPSSRWSRPTRRCCRISATPSPAG